MAQIIGVSPISVCCNSVIYVGIYMPTMWLQPRATPRSTLPPGDHYHQDIARPAGSSHRPQPGQPQHQREPGQRPFPHRGQCPVKQPCRMSSLLPNFPGPFQSPPTSAPGELVEPSGTVLRQAQDERVRSTPNILKGPASFQYGRLACWWFPEPVPVSYNSSLHITAATTTFPASHADVGGHKTEALKCPGG